MKRIIVFLTLILSVGCNEAPHESISFEDTNGSIIGGTRIDPMSIPARSTVYIGLGYYKNGKPVYESRCSGVLISKRAILTAAHCVDGADGIDYDIFKTFVVFGADLSDKSKLIAWFSSKIIIHPSFTQEEMSGSKTPYDIAIVTIDKDAPYPFMPAQILRDFGSLELGERLLFLGYGLISVNPPTKSTYLKSVPLPLAGILHNNLEVRGTAEDNICGGDSGGPIFIVQDGKYYLIGTTVGGRIKDDRMPECTHPGVITRLDYVKDFIAPYIQQ